MGLVLTRTLGESFVIQTPSGEIIQCVLKEKVKSGIRISIEAPKEVKIYRSEILQRMQKEYEEGKCILKNTK